MRPNAMHLACIAKVSSQTLGPNPLSRLGKDRPKKETVLGLRKLSPIKKPRWWNTPEKQGPNGALGDSLSQGILRAQIA